jgi:membrane protease YdiL (CAAX protease family)
MDSAPPEQRTPFWTWSDILYAGMLAVPFFIAGVFLSAPLMRVLPEAKPKAVEILVPQFVGFALALIPLAFMFRVRYDQPLWRSVNFGIPAGEWHRSLLAGVGLSVAVLTLGVLLRTPRIPSPIQELFDDPASAPYLMVAAVTLAPLFEELVFRGLLQPLLVRSAGAMAGVFLAALPFALLHGPEYGWSWRHVLLILVAGVGFGLKRLRTNSTGAAAIMHSAYNAVNTSLYIFGRNLIDG